MVVQLQEVITELHGGQICLLVLVTSHFETLTAQTDPCLADPWMLVLTSP